MVEKQYGKGLTFSGNGFMGQAFEERGGTTSVFDPVLTELVYRWFCPKQGIILDPFAGGSVRGLVASRLDRSYVGVELRQEQVAANKNQLHIALERQPDWRHGDSKCIADICSDIQADFVFSCPPYGDLESYSDDPADLSNMKFDEFLAAYRQIIEATCGLLKDDRFACFVVGDFRDKKGLYRNFVGETVQAFLDAGLGLYNEAVLVTQAASLPLRTKNQFLAGRKLGKTHQNVLVFVKGSFKNAVDAIGPVEFGEIEPDHSPSE